MNLEEEIQIMEMKESYSLTGFGKEIEEKLAIKGIDESNYTPSLEEENNQAIEADDSGQGIEQPEQAPEPGEMTIPGPNASIITDEQIPEPIQNNENDNDRDEWTSARKSRVLALGAAAIILIIAIAGIILTNSGGLTGYTIATREIQQATELNQVFNQYTETQLELNNIIGLKISGKLEGTGARVILRINGTDYLVADIINPATQNQTAPEQAPQYAISTDKTSYAIGEAVTLIITPDTENKSLYVSFGEQTQKLEANTYTPEAIGEYQAIALIVLTDNILRLETNFTVSNESINETTPPETPAPEPTPQETAGYEFTAICTDTCNIPENSNPILIIETEENSTLTITQITTTQQKENNAPIQIQVIPDINLISGQATTLNLDVK